MALSSPDTQPTGEQSSLGTQVSKQTTDIKHLNVNAMPRIYNTGLGDPTDRGFVEGGIEGWKVVFGCALISASTIGVT